MKKLLYRICIITVSVLMLCIISTLTYMYNRQIYMPNQLINGVDYGYHFSDVTYQELFKDVPDTVELLTTNNTVYLSTDFITVPEYSSLKQNFIDWLMVKPINVTKYINSDKLKTNLDDLYKVCSDAELVKGPNGFYIKSEEYGFQFNDNLYSHILSNVKNGCYVIDCSDYVKVPTTVTADLDDVYSDVKWLNDFNITYDSGYSINYNSLKDYIQNYELNVPESYWTNVIDYLHNTYCTTNNSLTFQTNSMESINIPYYTYGYSLDKDKELEFIKQCIVDKTSVSDRIPYLKGYDNLGNTYVEISIEQQHLWYYVDGVIFMETDIVTGTENVHDTPKGVFYITERIDGKYLRGADYVTWVDKWMRLTNSGIGLHDASWRSQFGTNIYKHDGSHGCINLPKTFAYDLFDNVYVGLPVIIY